jgi:hypothetical protein
VKNRRLFVCSNAIDDSFIVFSRTRTKVVEGKQTPPPEAGCRHIVVVVDDEQIAAATCGRVEGDC